MSVGAGGFHGVGEKDVAVAGSDRAHRLDAENELYVITIDKAEQEVMDAAVWERSVLKSNPVN